MMDERRLERMYRQARPARWGLPREAFRQAIERAIEHGAGAAAIHLEDLALACACAAGLEDAWEHFVREHRPSLYRAADALDPSGGAREIADELYADLYGLRERNGERLSLFRYYHGRSSLATWLRAVLAQRVVDRVRRERRFDPLPDADAAAAPAAAAIDPDRPRFVAAMVRALTAALAALGARDRLRLACYYQQNLTLAQIGRLLKEHEATASRHLARTRRGVRADVEARLGREGFSPAEIDRCFELLLEDVEDADLARLLDAPAGKDSDPERSI